VLRAAETEGDTLLGLDETLDRAEKLPLSAPCTLGSDWVLTHQDFLGGVVETLAVTAGGGPEAMTALQLTRTQSIEAGLRKILMARCAAAAPAIQESWQGLLVSAIGKKADLKDARSKKALAEQTQALQVLVSRKMTILTGRAGTGKTSVVGALFQSLKLKSQGILLLAPTGKARVRLTKATKAEAQTLAQFLYGRTRYDGERQRSLLDPKNPEKGTPYANERTVVIDECSMITAADLYAVLRALDLQHVQRIILVGDPNQLPPTVRVGPSPTWSAHCDSGSRQKTRK
jgi:ATP-dependent exoDNAse (exonuclease V) alpha subunit